MSKMRKMKDSGIEWIGEIPEEWGIIKNKYLLISMYSVGTPNVSNSDFYSDEGIPFVSISDMSSADYVVETKKHLTADGVRDKNLVKLPVGTILYSIYATVGAISELRIEATISQAMLALNLNSQMNKTYYKYNLRAMRDYIYSSANGNTQFNLNADKVWNFSFVFPYAKAQTRIANFLDDKCGKIDRYIETQRAIIEKLKAYKQAVITQAVTKGLDPTVPMKDSGVDWIGEIPEGWRVGQLKYFVKIRSGITLGKKYSPETELKEYPYLRVANVQGEYTDLSDVAMISVPEDEAQKYILHTGELLMTEGGDRDKLGRGCVWEGKITPCLHQNHVFAVTANALILNVYYLDYVTTSDVGRSYFDYTAKKTTNLASTNSTTILQFRLPVPPIEEQQKIVQYLKEKVDELNQMLTKHLALIDKLTEYKKSLIYEAVTGKKEV